MTRTSIGERTAASALLFLVGVTAAWWALALWPSGEAPPEWLARARLVCFNARPDGLPDASGWLLLVGQPLGMLAVLMAVWGESVRDGLRGAARSRKGRALLVSCAGLLALGLTASGARIISVVAAERAPFAGREAPLPDTYPRLDREAPALSLVDQRGERLGLEALRGRPALVTFAFGSCETVCPAVVHQTLAAQELLRRRAAEGGHAFGSVPRVVIVSLDPWRDTPSRLAHLARHWDLGEDAFVLSGSVDEVEAVLDAWNVARSREPRTGDVTHPALVYVVDPTGSIAYAAGGSAAVLVELLGRV